MIEELESIKEEDHQPNYTELYEKVVSLRNKLLHMEARVNELRSDDYDSDSSTSSTISNESVIDVKEVKLARSELKLALIDKKYLIKSASNMFVRRSLTDCRLNEVTLDEETEENENFGKYCVYCEDYFHVKDYSDHLRSEFHRVKE